MALSFDSASLSTLNSGPDEGIHLGMGKSASGKSEAKLMRRKKRARKIAMILKIAWNFASMFGIRLRLNNNAANALYVRAKSPYSQSKQQASIGLIIERQNAKTTIHQGWRDRIEKKKDEVENRVWSPGRVNILSYSKSRGLGGR